MGAIQRDRRGARHGHNGGGDGDRRASDSDGQATTNAATTATGWRRLSLVSFSWESFGGLVAPVALSVCWPLAPRRCCTGPGHMGSGTCGNGAPEPPRAWLRRCRQRRAAARNFSIGPTKNAAAQAAQAGTQPAATRARRQPAQATGAERRHRQRRHRQQPATTTTAPATPTRHQHDGTSNNQRRRPAQTTGAMRGGNDGNGAAESLFVSFSWGGFWGTRCRRCLLCVLAIPARAARHSHAGAKQHGSGNPQATVPSAACSAAGRSPWVASPVPRTTKRQALAGSPCPGPTKTLRRWQGATPAPSVDPERHATAERRGFPCAGSVCWCRRQPTGYCFA